MFGGAYFGQSYFGQRYFGHLGADSTEAPTFDVLVEMFLNGVWTDVTADVLAEPTLNIRRGRWNVGPENDGMSETGECRFMLDNSTHNSAGTEGYYSPGRLDCRPGFTRGIEMRVNFSFGATTRVVFVGKVHSIVVQPGIYRDQNVAVTSLDWMDELARHDVVEVGPQDNATMDELAGVILDSMPSDSQPTDRTFDAGIDVFPFAFDDLEGGANAMQLLADVVKSERGRFAVLGPGTARLWNRQAVLLQEVTQTLTDSDLLELSSPGDMDRTFNRARVTVHPKRVEEGVIEVLTSLTGPAPEFEAGETKIFWLNYRDPDNDALSMGGKDFIDPLVASTDYLANSADDGSGSNLTGDFDVTASFFASTVKLEVTNTGSGVAFLTMLQGRGVAIRDLSPLTAESVVTKPYGLRTLFLDMPYQNSVNVAQDVADTLVAQYSSEDRPDVDRVTFHPHDSDALMVAAIERDIGERVQVTEEMTGLVTADVLITGVELTVTIGLQLAVTWAVQTLFIYDAWILEDPVRSILDSTTVLSGA